MNTEPHKLRWLPKWLIVLYIFASASLVPWIIVLSASLPTRHLSHHYDLAWVGFDIGLLIALGVTGYLAYRRSWWVGMASMSVFTLLLIDAWFDVLTAHPGKQLMQALFSALIIELPLALISLWLAYNVTKQLVKHRHEHS